jgi:hypothetical protein
MVETSADWNESRVLYIAVQSSAVQTRGRPLASAPPVPPPSSADDIEDARACVEVGSDVTAAVVGSLGERTVAGEQKPPRRTQTDCI